MSRDPNLLLRSSKQVDELAVQGSGLRGRSSPDLGIGVGVELGGGEGDRVGDLGGVGEGLPGEHGLAQQPPPALGQVQLAGLLSSPTPMPSEISILILLALK